MTEDDIFRGCYDLMHADLVEGEVYATVAALQLEEWRNDIKQEIASINQILPNTCPGRYGEVEKARVIRRWIRSVLRKLNRYQEAHNRLLNEAAAILQFALPCDIVTKSVLPLLEFPSHTFEVEDESDDEEDDNAEAKDDGEVSEGDEVNDQNDDQNRHIFCCLRKWPCPMRKERGR